MKKEESPDIARKAALVAGLFKAMGVGPIDSPDGRVAAKMVSMAPTQRPATLDEVLAFNQPHDPPLGVGDAVRWRKNRRDARWPEDTEVCIVSQVLDPPLRSFNTSSTQAGERNDVVLAFVRTRLGEGDEEAEAETEYVEFVYDSRRLERVESQD